MAEAPPLLLLHGALGARDQLAPLAARLAEDYQVLVLEFEGHGAVRDAGRPFRIEHFAANVSDYLDAQSLDSPPVFGYSMGGYVALYLERQAPGRLGPIVTLGTKLRWRPEEAEREQALLDPEAISAKVPQFAATLRHRHGSEGWRQVLARTAEMMVWMGQHPPLDDADFAALDRPLRLMVGDRDTTAALEDTVGVFRLLPRAQLAVLPGTPHPLDRADPDRLAELITDFLVGGG